MFIINNPVAIIAATNKKSISASIICYLILQKVCQFLILYDDEFEVVDQSILIIFLY